MRAASEEAAAAADSGAGGGGTTHWLDVGSEEGRWYLHTLNAFYLLACKLGKQRRHRRLQQLPAVKDSEVCESGSPSIGICMQPSPQ
jgi:hypothetical protein